MVSYNFFISLLENHMKMECAMKLLTANGTRVYLLIVKIDQTRT